ncbi:toprim domain-containing protein [Virgibacillus oceani]
MTWGIDYLVGLEEPEAYDSKYKKWSMHNLPVLPIKMKYQVNKKTSKQFNADSIIIATDPDSEGKNTAYSILILCGKNNIE